MSVIVPSNISSAVTSSDVNGYGTSIAYYSANPYLTTVSGVQCVQDAILVMLSTSGLFYQPGFGYNLNALVNSSTDPSTAVAAIEQQIKSDPRVASVSTTWSFTGSTLTIASAVTLTGQEQFTLVGELDTLDGSEFQFSIAGIS